MKLELSIDDFESISEAADKVVRAKNPKVKGVSVHSLRTLLADHGRALSKLVELGEPIEEKYAYHSKVRKNRQD